jgi:hypothetical protein
VNRQATGVKRFLVAFACLLLSTIACAHRYGEDPDDWVGPRNGDFEADFSVCRKRMDEAPFRYRGDPRLLLLGCMKKHGWHLKGNN